SRSCRRARSFGQVDRGLEGGELPPALVVLGARVGVGDDAGAGLEEREAVVEDDGADGDTGVDRIARQGVPDGARVRAATVVLELGDQLHRSHLRRSRHGPGREAGAEEVEVADTLLELARDLGDEMRDVRVALGLEEATDLDAAGTADAREVVPAEID